MTQAEFNKLKPGDCIMGNVCGGVFTVVRNASRGEFIIKAGSELTYLASTAACWTKVRKLKPRKVE